MTRSDGKILFYLILLLTIMVCDCAPMKAFARHSISKIDKEDCLRHAVLKCVVTPCEGYKTNGTVLFKPTWVMAVRGFYQCVTQIYGKVYNLSPGKHGFHIHVYGDVSRGDGTSTGGHFSNANGGEIGHGFPGSLKRHMGDLGNIVGRGNGIGLYRRVDWRIDLDLIVGRAMTIHAGEDKGKLFQPSGDAGPRIGTCVIGYANPDTLRRQ